MLLQDGEGGGGRLNGEFGCLAFWLWSRVSGEREAVSEGGEYENGGFLTGYIYLWTLLSTLHL